MFRDQVILNPPGADVDLELLQRFEDALDPAKPGQGAIPCQILGYGEISTVFVIDVPSLHQFACKRISIFEDTAELQSYLHSYCEYHRLLVEEIGIILPPNGYAAFTSASGRPVFYSIQQKLDPRTMGQNALHQLSVNEALLLVERALEEAQRIWEYNATQETIEVAIDGQISNWAIVSDDPAHLVVDKRTPLVYIDTSTPLFRVDGVEQLQAELFLRPAASFMVPILRRFFLDDVVARYYDPRQVAIDLIANIFKEQRPELIRPLVAMANEFLGRMQLKPVTVAQVKSYYQQDKFIWQLYAATRRIDCQLHQLSGRTYPYILPGRVER